MRRVKRDVSRLAKRHATEGTIAEAHAARVTHGVAVTPRRTLSFARPNENVRLGEPASRRDDAQTPRAFFGVVLVDAAPPAERAGSERSPRLQK